MAQRWTKPSMECRICKTEFDSLTILNKHLFPKHGIKTEAYYREYFPRFDIFDNKPIEFKSVEQYFSSEFNNRGNMVRWFNNADGEKVREMALKLLKNRKEKKNLINAPHHVYLKTIMCPSVPVFEKFFTGGYAAVVKRVGLNLSFDYRLRLSPAPPQPMTIICDTREQNPLRFDNTVEIVNKKLPFGDYALKELPDISIERKSLGDFCGTMSSGHDRFINEVELAKKSGSYLVVLVEESLNRSLHFDEFNYNFSRATPAFIFKQMRQILDSFGNIQFLFVPSRSEASRVVKTILSNGKHVQNIDLEFLYDLGKL